MQHIVYIFVKSSANMTCQKNKKKKNNNQQDRILTKYPGTTK